jgi:hypothetical protein
LLFNNPSDNYNPKWVADNATPLSKNSLLSNGAKYYTSGGTDINFAVTSGSYYTLIIGENSGSSNNLSILETTYNPTNFTSVSQSPLSPAVYAGESVTVSAVMAATLNSGEFLYLRYSTDGFSTSTVIAMSFSSGTTYTASIPTLTSGTVSYYLYTSNLSSAPTPSESDFYSLNIYNSSGQNQNLGTNYSYTVNTWATVLGASNWSTAASWNASKVPSTMNSLGAITIGHSITVNQTAIISSATVSTGATLTIGSGSTLQIGGGITTSGSGTFAINGTLQINSGGFTNIVPTYGSSGSLTYNSGGTYDRSNEWPSTNGPVNVTLSNSTTLTLGLARILTGVLTLNASCVLTSNGNLTLKSDASGTASIAAIGTSGSITGNVNVERFIPAQANKRYRFLSSPVNTTVADWRGEIFITGGGVDGQFSSVGTNNIKTANGFDWTLSGAPSLYGYTENLNSGGLNTRWVASTNANTDNLIAGKGYRVFIRGDRSNAGVLDNSVTSQSAVTIISTGALNTGNQTLPATYNGVGTDNGWNLVGNPYASTIDWNASSGWTKTGVSGTIWIYRPSTNTYGNWDGSTATNNVTQFISSGQAFFVRTTATPTLSCTEAVKVASAGASIFKTAEINTLRIGLVKDESNKDETVIRFMEGKNNEFSEDDDVTKYYNPTVNVSSFFGTDKYASVNYLKNELTEDKIIPISAWVDEVGNYKMNFTGMNDFTLTKNIFIKDKFLNTITDIEINPSVDFVITSDTNSKGDNRFEIIFTAKGSTNTKEDLLKTVNTNLSVYPNPATEVLNISISNANFKNSEVVVLNISGTEIFKTNMANNNTQLNIETLSNGVYFVKVSNQNGFNKTVKFVK